jgi:hypothetical protein
MVSLSRNSCWSAWARQPAGKAAEEQTGVSSGRFCQINVVMSAGAVSAVNYRGPTAALSRPANNMPTLSMRASKPRKPVEIRAED